MEILTKSELQLRKKEMMLAIEKGAVFIHPTDTIYGLGCNALDEKAVKKIRKLKNRQKAHFSVWVPSLEWIKQNCVLNLASNKWLKELPGPYTFVLKLKNKKSVSPAVIPGINELGIRIPDHWFHQFVEELGLPIVTTSANITGKEFMTSLNNLDMEIKKGVDFIIYEGEKKARPSKIINLVKEEIITER